MNQLEKRNQKIIDALILKANRLCPGSLALVGIYGSFLTGDFYDKSDLDLMIVINDDRGYRLSCTFLQDDLQVGHDIYCTTWESLERDAMYNHPNISKLMDSRIVYCADDKYLQRLEALRRKAAALLTAPFTREDYKKAETQLISAEASFARVATGKAMEDVYFYMARFLTQVENAIAMLNKRYFRYGVKRVFEEIEAMDRKPKDYRKLAEAALEATSPEAARQHLTALLAEVHRVFKAAEVTVAPQKQPPTADALRGTYEEMFSNWRNKIHAAAATGDRHLALANIHATQEMMNEIAAQTKIGDYSVMTCYDGSDLAKTAQNYDEVLNNYLREYEKARLPLRCYPDIDAFIEDYLK